MFDVPGLLGTLGGLLGTLISGATKVFVLKEKNRHEEAVLKYEAETAQRESADELQQVSYDHDELRYFRGKQGRVAKFFFGVLDFLRGVMRPGLTLWMTYLNYQIYANLTIFIGGLAALTAAQQFGLYNETLWAIRELWITAFLWWFGGRELRKT